MPKIFNVVAMLLGEVIAMALVYAMWSPATAMIATMANEFKPLASFMWVLICMVAILIGPVLLATQDSEITK